MRTLYREFDIPTDQYPRRPDDLARLVRHWNNLTGRNEPAAEVLHYMITRRKKGKWERLGRDAGRASPPSLSLSDEELGHLDAIHEELQIASDNYALNPEAAQRLQEEFARRTNRVLPPMLLAAAMIHRRKLGNLATLRPKSDQNDVGFTDIDQVGT